MHDAGENSQERGASRMQQGKLEQLGKSNQESSQAREVMGAQLRDII
jgi:hypothetical protein